MGLIRTVGVVLAAVGLVAIGALGTALFYGVGPVAGSTDSGAGSFPTATSGGGAGAPSDGSDGGDATGTTTAAEDGLPYSVAIERVEECGRTCRDVTATLTNERDTTAENVTVYTRIFVGNGTDGEVIWSGTRSVGTLAPGASDTATERIELSYSEALAVERHDGRITVQTTVESADETVTVTERRDVT